MKRNLLWLIAVTGFIAPVQLLFAEETIPEEFSSIAVDAPNAYDFVKACIPAMSESAFNQSVKDAADKKTVTTWPLNRSKSFLAVTKGTAYCVNISAQRNPVLPLSVFEETITFTEMSKDEVIKLRADLSMQLAMSGSATALVINEKGNAYKIAYLFSSDTPRKIVYRAGFLKKGEFDETKFSSVYRAGGSMSVIARGQPAENYKPFF